MSPASITEARKSVLTFKETIVNDGSVFRVYSVYLVQKRDFTSIHVKIEDLRFFLCEKILLYKADLVLIHIKQD